LKERPTDGPSSAKAIAEDRRPIIPDHFHELACPSEPTEIWSTELA
jgi:hypothetical protein